MALAALITGGTSGLGLGIADRLLRDGGRVVVTGRDEAMGAAATESLGEGSRFVAADAADEAAIERSVGLAVDMLGRLDLLVNNAGIAVTERLVDTPTSLFDRLFAVNVRAYFLYARACLPHLAETGGSIVHIASDAGLRGEQHIGAYSVSKAATVMMSKMLALDGASLGVRSNCVCPGATAPGMRHSGPAEDPDRGEDPSAWSAAPLGRIGQPEDVASCVTYLAGAEAGFVSGAVVLVDGANGAGLAA